jgi:hypothetical protein
MGYYLLYYYFANMLSLDILSYTRGNSQCWGRVDMQLSKKGVSWGGKMIGGGGGTENPCTQLGDTHVQCCQVAVATAK